MNVTEIEILLKTLAGEAFDLDTFPYRFINSDPVTVENLIHRFFAEGRLDIEIMDKFGKAIRPREWFLIPLTLIEQAIALLMDGSIVDYYYDSNLDEIIRR